MGEDEAEQLENPEKERTDWEAIIADREAKDWTWWSVASEPDMRPRWKKKRYILSAAFLVWFVYSVSAPAFIWKIRNVRFTNSGSISSVQPLQELMSSYIEIGDTEEELLFFIDDNNLYYTIHDNERAAGWWLRELGFDPTEKNENWKIISASYYEGFIPNFFFSFIFGTRYSFVFHLIDEKVVKTQLKVFTSSL